MKFDDLDCRQNLVVTSIVNSNERLLVVGGPGTGKTTTALWAARSYLEQTQELPAPRVLFLTFSRSAVAQIASRSQGVLDGIDGRVEILTFHGLSYRVLRAFGRYSGLGQSLPEVESEARAKLRGRDNSRLSYDDLLDGATRLLTKSSRLRALMVSRWGLVICDEAQATSEVQWRLLQLLAARKVILLGDPNQMIYGFVPGVSVEGFERIREWAGREIQLMPRSHRDPTGAIPAMAEAVRIRDFHNDAVVEAIKSGRLTIHFDVGEPQIGDYLRKEIKRARALGSRDVGVFAHSNAAVFELGEALNAQRIDHAVIGIPEAHAEALNAMAVQCRFGVDLASDADVREALAIFLTAASRGRDAPPLAIQLDTGNGLPPVIGASLEELRLALHSADQSTIGELAIIAGQSWERLRINPARRAWFRATRHFGRLIAPLSELPASEENVVRLTEIVERARTGALIERDYSERGRVKLMNYHQTKGREADTVIHVFRSDDYFGREREPFADSSRLLHVAVSRAKRRVVILLPPVPHDLVHPFTALREIQAEVQDQDASELPLT